MMEKTERKPFREKTDETVGSIAQMTGLSKAAVKKLICMSAEDIAFVDRMLTSDMFRPISNVMVFSKYEI